MKNFFIKNYKTSIAGLLLAIIAYLSYEQIINPGQTALLTALVASIGNFFAKDADSTGLAYPSMTYVGRISMDITDKEGFIVQQTDFYGVGAIEYPRGFYKVINGQWEYLGENI
jgi:hypothetical protein